MALGGGASKPSFLQGASNLTGGAPSGIAGKQSLLGGMGASQKPMSAGGGFLYGSTSKEGGGGPASLFGAASAAQGGNSFQTGLGGTSFGSVSKAGGGFAFG